MSTKEIVVSSAVLIVNDWKCWIISNRLKVKEIRWIGKSKEKEKSICISR